MEYFAIFDNRSPVILLKNDFIWAQKTKFSVPINLNEYDKYVIKRGSRK